MKTPHQPTPTSSFRTLALAAGVLFGASTAVQADDYDWPRMLVIGTPSTQTASFASTNGWAPILQKEGGPVVRVIPEDSESMRYRRLTMRKDLQLSSVSASEVQGQIEGTDAYAGLPAEQQRLIWHHNDTPWGLVVAGDSKLQSADDLKKGDVRISKGIFSPIMGRSVTEALPAYLGLSKEQAEEKFSYRPASSYPENCRAVVEGKADVAWCSPVSSVLSEMEGSPGSIRWLSMDLDDKESWERYLDKRSMAIPAEITMGVETAQGVGGVVSNFLYMAPKDTDEELAYQLAKWFHQSYEKYKKTHPMSARMSLEVFRSYLDRTPLPVHEGTVKYLREIGAWTEEDDAWNQAAINKMNRWTEARAAALKEAREKRVEPRADNPDYAKIFEKHTGDLEGFRSRL